MDCQPSLDEVTNYPDNKKTNIKNIWKKVNNYQGDLNLKVLRELVEICRKRLC